MIDPDLSRAAWHKSSRSNSNGGACIEVAAVSDATAVRDSKDPDGPALVFSRPVFGAFLGYLKTSHIKTGELDT